MSIVRGLTKTVSCLLIAAMLGLSLPHYSARAAMVETETVIRDAPAAQSDRARLRALLSREEARSHLESYGLSRAEALARVDSLTDEEITQIAGKLDELPAGGALEGLTALFAVVLVATVFLFLGIAYLLEKLFETASEDGDES